MTGQATTASVVAGEHLLRLRDVTAKTGLGKTKIYSMLEDREFPRPVKLGGVAVRWKASEVDAWIASLPSA